MTVICRVRKGPDIIFSIIRSIRMDGSRTYWFDNWYETLHGRQIGVKELLILIIKSYLITEISTLSLVKWANLQSGCLLVKFGEKKRNIHWTESGDWAHVADLSDLFNSPCSICYMHFVPQSCYQTTQKSWQPKLRRLLCLKLNLTAYLFTQYWQAFAFVLSCRYPVWTRISNRLVLHTIIVSPLSMASAIHDLSCSPLVR